MATLIVTFTAAFGNVAAGQAGNIAGGSGARSETITLPDTTNLSAASGDAAVELLASADCWVAIGVDPDPAAASDGTRHAHYVKANLPYQYRTAIGEFVAAEED